MKISVTIITLNEQEKLPKTIASVRDLADEIIVVDSGSSDKTVDIAKSLGAKVYLRQFDNYANQKNYAVSLTNNEWILSLDGDEEISPELAKEIRSLITNHQLRFVAYSIPRKNYILGKWIRYTRWQPELDRHIWLWKKSMGKWEGEVHEEVVVTGPVGKLKEAKKHHQYASIREFIGMINSYSEIEAKEKNFSFFRLFFDPIYNFCVRYIYRLGFLDGWRGFVLSYLMGVYHLIVWVKVWEKQR